MEEKLMYKFLFLTLLFLSSNSFSQREEATITRTFGTNSVYPRQFPSMTIRKMNDNEYWLYDSLGTNTIFHRIFPTYIVRKQNTYTSSQQWGVYRTTSTNSVYPRQFPDRYISDLDWRKDSIENGVDKNLSNNRYSYKNSDFDTKLINNPEIIENGYTYTRSLRSDKKAAYSAESPE
jgi:hypothetical protein